LFNSINQIQRKYSNPATEEIKAAITSTLGASTQLQPPIFIHPQQTRRRSADCGQSDNLTTTPREMFIPIIQSRMKQACQFFSLRIKPGKICSFVQIAVMASELQIVRRVFAAMLGVE